MIFLGFGLLLVIITPPIGTVDESAHLYRSFQVSQLNLIPDNVGTESGGKIPIGLAKLVLSNIHDPSYRYTSKTIAGQKDLNIDSTTMDLEFTNVSIYPPVDYAPQAVGLKLGGLFTKRSLVQFYMARLTNLLFLATMLALAIQIIPVGKKAFMILLLSPMVVYSGASLSADAFTIAAIAVYSAYLFKLFTQQARIVRRQWLILCLLACAVALAKQTYIIFAATTIILAFRGKRFNLSDAWKACLAAFVAVLLGALWLGAISHMHTMPVHLQETVGIHVNAGLQRDYILQNPVQFLHTIGNTLNIEIVRSFFGIIGPGDTYLPVICYYIIVVLVFLAFGLDVESHKRVHFGRIPTIVLIGAVSLHVVVTLVSLYLLWTNPYKPVIDGLQARYFIPDFLILAPLLMGRYRHTIKTRPIIIMMVLMLVVATLTTLKRFYNVL